MSALPSQSFISRSYTMIVVASCCRAITLEWSGRGSNPQPQHCEGWGVWEFQSPRRWVGLEFDQQIRSAKTPEPRDFVSIPSEVGRGPGTIRRYVNCVAGRNRFNPLGGGRGRARINYFQYSRIHPPFQSPRRWGGVGLPAHAEGHGANLGQRVSIPSEVGRGRAGPSGRPCSTPSCLVSIPSEVGRGRADPSGKPCSTPSLLGFNPLGGGAGSGSPRTPLRHSFATHHAVCSVSIPSEVGRGRAPPL